MAHRVDIVQVVFVRHLSGTERYPVNGIAILHRRRERGGVIRYPTRGGVGREGIDDEGARDPAWIGERRRCARGRPRRSAARPGRTAVEESAGAGHADTSCSTGWVVSRTAGVEPITGPSRR